MVYSLQLAFIGGSGEKHCNTSFYEQEILPHYRVTHCQAVVALGTVPFYNDLLSAACETKEGFQPNSAERVQNYWTKIEGPHGVAGRQRLHQNLLRLIKT